MVSHIGAGGPQPEDVTFGKALVFALIGTLLIIAFYFWWPQESEQTKVEDRPTPAKVKPPETTRADTPQITTVGGDWKPTRNQYWRSFAACREYGYEPSGLITSIPGTVDISQCDFAANLAMRTPIVTSAFITMMRSGGAPDDPERLVRKCQQIVLPMLDDWAYLGNRPEFDGHATQPFVALALRCQVLVRDFPKPDPRPGRAVFREAQPLLADSQMY